MIAFTGNIHGFYQYFNNGEYYKIIFMCAYLALRVSSISKLYILKENQNQIALTNTQLTPINTYPANIHLFEVNNRNIRKRCEIC